MLKIEKNHRSVSQLRGQLKSFTNRRNSWGLAAQALDVLESDWILESYNKLQPKAKAKT